MEKCLPHARGGVSGNFIRPMYRKGSSPRPWGCFLYDINSSYPYAVFPTPVGVFPCQTLFRLFFCRLPHARGGVSHIFRRISPAVRSSPRPWGCFCSQRQSRHGYLVFPTPVGVFPLAYVSAQSARGLPHARGGVSLIKYRWSRKPSSSPRPWGCFCVYISRVRQHSVFPTPVGVFLR